MKGIQPRLEVKSHRCTGLCCVRHQFFYSFSIDLVCFVTRIYINIVDTFLVSEKHDLI